MHRRELIGVLLSLSVASGCSSPPGNLVADGDMSAGGGGGGDGDMAPVAFSIAPETASLGFGQSITFTATKPVTWSVVEPGGGTIDATGRYTAPFVPGTVHVHAVTTTAEPTEEATATVSVADHSLALVAGTYGGHGTADGIGAAARFTSVRGMAYDGTRYLYFADYGAVRRLDTTNNEVTTLAGHVMYSSGSADGVGSAAQFGIAWGVALDGQGALYVADATNDTIRKLDLQTRAVTTVAGAAGVADKVDDNGTAARFNRPMGLAYDAAGKRLFIADYGNQAIRVYDTTTTAVTTLSTTLYGPDGLAWDGSGTLYAVDALAQQVASIDVATKSATLIAGYGRGYRDGVGTQAHFDAPSPVALEGGALYIGDTVGLRKMDLASGQVTTLPVRGGDARNFIAALGDGHGHVWTFSNGDYSIFEMTVATGASAVIAGPDGYGIGSVDGVGAAARFFDPGDLESTTTGALYVSDLDNNEVRRVDLSSAGVSTVLGTPLTDGADGVGRKGHLNMPASLASDHAGTVFVVEPETATIRKWVAATNTLTTLAGRAHLSGSADGTGGAALFDYPVAACVDGGALYVADRLNSTIRKVTIASGVVETIAGLAEEPGHVDGAGAAARFNEPTGIACDGAGTVYVADSGSFTIRRIVVASKTVDTVAGSGKGLVDNPGASAKFFALGELAYANGFLYAVDNGYQNLHLRKIQVGGTWDVSTIATSTASGQQFYGVAVDGSGVVYVSNKQFGSSTISTVASDGSLKPFAGSSTKAGGLVVDGVGAAASFNGAAGMVFDGTSLLVGEPAGLAVRRIDPSTAKVTTAFGIGRFSPAVGGTGADATIYVPTGLAALDANTLFVSDHETIDQVAMPAASLAIAAGAVGSGGGVDDVGAKARLWPQELAYDGNGTLYFTDAYSVRRYIVASGKVETIAGQSGSDGAVDGVGAAARFYRPRGLALDGAGNLYVSDMRNDTIRKVVLATGEVSTFAGKATMSGAVDGVGDNARFAFPMGMVYDGKGSLFVADSENGAIRRVELATRAVTTYVGVLGQRGMQPGALPARLNTPRGLALLPDGGLAVTDEQAVLVVH